MERTWKGRRYFLGGALERVGRVPIALGWMRRGGDAGSSGRCWVDTRLGNLAMDVSGRLVGETSSGCLGWHRVRSHGRVNLLIGSGVRWSRLTGSRVGWCLVTGPRVCQHLMTGCC